MPRCARLDLVIADGQPNAAGTERLVGGKGRDRQRNAVGDRRDGRAAGQPGFERNAL